MCSGRSSSFFLDSSQNMICFQLLLVTVYTAVNVKCSLPCPAQRFYKEEQTNIDAAMVWKYVETTSAPECARTCNSVTNCTGLIYCSSDMKCSILTTGQRVVPVSVPNLTCKVFTEFATSSQTSPSCQNGGTPDGDVCLCPPAFTGGKCETRMEDCTDVSLYIGNSPGTYTVWPTKAAQQVDLECQGVSTLIMFRDKTFRGCEAVPVTYLDVPWADYRSGFTHSNCYMWLGLEKMHVLTSVRPNKLYILLRKDNATHGYYLLVYDAFSVGDEASEYRLSVSGFNGDGVFGDGFNLGDPASTMDGSHFCAKDHCKNSVNPCAEWHGGAWWNRLDVCQKNPHHQRDIYWNLADGTPYECISISMFIAPA